MKDFSTFLQQGVGAAKAAANARAEIDDVFDELNQQLAAAFGDATVRIAVRQFYEQSGMDFVKSFLDRKQYSALVIEGVPSNVFSAEIARWKRPFEGYPCWIVTRGREVSCESRVALESELAQLVSSAYVGQAILDAVARSNAKAAPTPPAAEQP
jgi:hypothetical protein